MGNVWNQHIRMKNYKGHPSKNFLALGFLLACLCLICCSTAKRFDIANSNFGIEDFDIPELIEINKLDPVKPPVSNKVKPNKPKPEFTLPLFPQLPQNLGLSSTWTLGSNFGSSQVPEFSAHRPPTPNSPYYSQPPAPSATSETSLFLTPGHSGISHGYNFGPPPRPPPIISSNALSDSTHETAAWVTQPQSPPLVSSQQTQPQSSSPPVFLEEVLIPTSSSQPSPSWPSQHSSATSQPPWSAQTSSVTVQAPPPQSWSQPPAPVASQSSPQWISEPSQPPPSYTTSQPPQWLAQPLSVPVASQEPQWYSQPPSQQQPSWSSQPPSQQQPSWSSQPPSQQQPSWSSQHPSSSSKPFSLYEQLNLHLLEPYTWDKLLDSNKIESEQNQMKPPTALQHDQGSQVPMRPPNPSYDLFALISSQQSQPPPHQLYQPLDVFIAINSTGSGANNAANNGATSIIDTGNTNAILDPIDSMVDYIHPGQPAIPQITNSDITVDDDKFFDNDDDFMVVDEENDDDEIMKMVE